MYTNSTPSIYQFLAGAWLFVNQTIWYDDGTILSREKIGTLQYTSSGYMSAQMMETDPSLRPLTVNYPPNANESDADWAITGRSTITYAGPYTVTPWNETHGNLTHGPFIYAGVQSWVGTSQKRDYTVYEEGNLLGVWIRSASSRSEIFWRRGESLTGY